MINWKVRIKNRAWWITFVPAVFLVIQAVLAIFGVVADFSELQGKILYAIDAVLALLTIMGVINDPTTKGISDSSRAMYYEEPFDSNVEEK